MCSQLLYFAHLGIMGGGNRFINRRSVSSIRSNRSDLTIGRAYQHSAVGEGVLILLCLVT